MKAGKLQVPLVLSLLALAVAYNAWVYLRPPGARAPIPSSEPPLLEGLQSSGPTVTGEAVNEVIDPRAIPPVPDINFARIPEWPRNPFDNPHVAVVDETPLPAAVAEPELVLAAILHSSQRRLAIVNGQIRRVGDRIGSATIRDIEPRAVVIESAHGARRTIELRVPFGNARVGR